MHFYDSFGKCVWIGYDFFEEPVPEGVRRSGRARKKSAKVLAMEEIKEEEAEVTSY